MSNTLDGKAVWIVGASAGIGAALAESMLDRGARVAISARRVDALESVSRGRMSCVPCDVGDRAAVAEAADAVRAAIGPIDIVVHNAGYWKQMDSTAWDADEFDKHILINVIGMGNVIAATLPDFVARRTGNFVGVASVAGYRGLAGSEGYGASKAAQINLLESLRVGLASRGVKVTTVCPGFVKTEMTSTNQFPMPFLQEPEEAAEDICAGLERGQQEIVFPLPMFAAMKAARLAPVRLWTAAASRAKA